MKKKQVLLYIAIILTILAVIANIYLYMKLHETSNRIIISKDSYQSAGLIIGSVFYYATFVYGLILLPIIWIEYFLVRLSMKIYNKLKGIKRTVSLVFTILFMILFLVLGGNIVVFILGILF